MVLFTSKDRYDNFSKLQEFLEGVSAWSLEIDESAKTYYLKTSPNNPF